jgi:hypothetical protein
MIRKLCAQLMKSSTLQKIRFRKKEKCPAFHEVKKQKEELQHFIKTLEKLNR